MFGGQHSVKGLQGRSIGVMFSSGLSLVPVVVTSVVEAGEVVVGLGVVVVGVGFVVDGLGVVVV